MLSRQNFFWLKSGFLLLLLLGAIFYVHTLPPFAQDPLYNDFADARTFFGIPNFFNVISNLGFCLAGALGIFTLLKPAKNDLVFLDTKERYFYLVFFTGVFLIGIGSGYYHWMPNNATLVWDRLPMTVAFMAFFAAIVAERISLRLAWYALLPLLLLGMFSVVYWRLTELAGVGDLRLYLFVQGFTVLAIPILILLFPAKYSSSFYVMLTFGFYVLAKMFETYDALFYRLTHQIVSGHVLKHLAAALAVYCIYVYLCRRRRHK